MKKILAKILLVDDESQILRFVKATLKAKNYDIECAHTGREAIAKARSYQPDLVVLDLGLPDMDGREVLQEIQAFLHKPVIVLSVRDAETEKVALLEAGAEDYITKPFSAPELVARIQVALRHALTDAGQQPIVSTGDIEVDIIQHVVKNKGEVVELSQKEYEVLQVLAINVGQIVTQQQLLTEVWGSVYGDELQYLRVAIGNLRRKLGDDAKRPRLILTIPGVGYKLGSSGN